MGREQPNFTTDQEFGAPLQLLLLQENPPGGGAQETGPQGDLASRLLCRLLAA